ncbi:adenosine monophosphate-protein transferase ficd [Plakobranchus ocellatus]|uniref:protein adenylyltransferase n=1 Tax=Plakobranchus ocellatus TaxID=259542 RepID=A0AAV4E267_9GAST|nr:adenosine monophosphate-protein transferase ficd [Plakobranchus ocellatus]
MLFILTRVIDIAIGLFTTKSVAIKMQIKIILALILIALVLSGLSYGILMDFPRAILAFFWTSIGYKTESLFSSAADKFAYKTRVHQHNYLSLKIGCLQDDGPVNCGVSSDSKAKPDTFFDTSISIRHKQRFQPSSDVKREAVAAMNIALDLQNRGRTEKAMKVFQHALALDPSHADILTAFGEFLEWHVKDVVKADHMYQVALENSPQHGRAMLNRNRTAPIVEEIDQETFNRVDQKRSLLYKIPNNHPGLRRAKKEAYFAHIYHTNAIEGNTLSLAQTRSIVETRLAVGGKSLREQNEVLGLDSALSFINSTLVGRVGRLTLQDILDIHTRVLGYVDPTEAGRFRNNQVYVGEFTPPPANELPEQMDGLVEWLNSPSSLALHPVEFAALAHYRLVTIHPFYDGNGRTSRLLMNLILMQAGFPPVSIEVSDRLAYYETLQQGNDGDIRPFIRFIARCAERTLDEYLSVTMDDPGNIIHTAMLQKGRFRPTDRVIVVGDDEDDSEDEYSLHNKKGEEVSTSSHDNDLCSNKPDGSFDDDSHFRTLTNDDVRSEARATDDDVRSEAQATDDDVRSEAQATDDENS